MITSLRDLSSVRRERRPSSGGRRFDPRRRATRRPLILTSLLAVAALLAVAGCRRPADGRIAGASTPGLPSAERLDVVRSYVKDGWGRLTRSHADLPAALIDEKVPHVEGTPWTLYISSREDPAAIRSALERSLTAAQLEGIRIERLPEAPRRAAPGIEPHGLLYLPYPYVVPGGRFNEMYGWDSYFILLGLLRDGEIELARNMVDNFLYEIEHYGMILNANRTYHITRSQPPFLTSMILGVFERTQDRDWLRLTLPAIEKYYRYWTSPPHTIEEYGLARYHGLGEGPAPEVVASEIDETGRTHYDRVREAYRNDPPTRYDLSLYYDPSSDRLTPLFYIGDRSMRESGFDPSNRFGPFSVDIIHYAPVCLNSLLYRMEIETARILDHLGRAGDAVPWRERAAARKDRINEHLWDEREGLYMDLHFPDGRLSGYPFASTFYPLWSGIATDAQARRVVENLPRFEARCGLRTSTTRSGSQWDAPYGWAPLQLIAVEGLRRYGYHHEAGRLAAAFIRVVVKEFEEHGAIFEKYDVERCESDIAEGIRFGYASNEIGFGWTNAVFLELLSGLSRPAAARPRAFPIPAAAPAGPRGVAARSGWLTILSPRGCQPCSG